jgi:hypothetical protein
MINRLSQDNLTADMLYRTLQPMPEHMMLCYSPFSYDNKSSNLVRYAKTARVDNETEPVV